MSVEAKEILEPQLNTWRYQPPVDLNRYELIPLKIPFYSVMIRGIDMLLWTQSDPTQEVENIAGRFLYNGHEYEWIVPGHSLAERNRNDMLEVPIPGGVKIPGGVQQHNLLSAALAGIHKKDLKKMSFKIQGPNPKFSVAITVQKIASYILHG